MSTTALALTLGVHLASLHVPAHDYQRNINPGLYLRVHEGARLGGIDLGALQGLTLGAYRNTLGRTSAYLGHTLTLAGGPGSAATVDVTLGAVSGYQRRCRSWVTWQPDAPGAHGPHGSGVTARTEWECLGSSNAVLAPFLAPSLTLPLHPFGLTPRLALIPGARNTATAVHLSVEKGF